MSLVAITPEEGRQLSFGLDHCFVDKSKYVKSNIGSYMECFADRIDTYIEPKDKENLHKLLKRTLINLQ